MNEGNGQMTTSINTKSAQGRRGDRRTTTRRSIALAMPLLALVACGGSGATQPAAGTATPASVDTIAAEPAVTGADSSDSDRDATDPPTTDEVASTTTVETPSITSAPSPTTPVVDPFDVVLDAVGEPTARYDNPTWWACRGFADDVLCNEDLAMTVINADGMAEVVERPVAETPQADCFYVAPTVDGRPEPGNARANPADPAVVAAAESIVRQQAAPFSALCRVFAPFYQQATFGSYDMLGPEPPDLTAEPFDFAYGQVLDAFRWYMANENDGRPIVLLGHSQGSHHLARLAAELFDTTPELADRLVMAGLIGAGGYGVNVADGDVVGGTFENLALCTDLEETGCVVAYNSYHVDTPPTHWFAAAPEEGTATACVNPSELVSGATTVTESVFDYPELAAGPLVADLSTIGLGDITTSLVSYPEAFEARCTSVGDSTWLEITPLDDENAERPEIPIGDVNMVGIGLGLHGLDFQLFAGDLLTLTEAKIASALAG